MAKVTIFISLKPGTTQLHLHDSEGHSGEAVNFLTDVSRGDVVEWEIDKKSGIEEVTAIRAKDGLFNILKDGAPRKKGNGDWVGHVREDASGADSYSIDFVVGSVGYAEDPTLRIKPAETE